VVEQALARDGAPFVANDCELSPPPELAPDVSTSSRPNMAGKSTYLRQNALTRPRRWAARAGEAGEDRGD